MPHWNLCVCVRACWMGSVCERASSRAAIATAPVPARTVANDEGVAPAGAETSVTTALDGTLHKRVVARHKGSDDPLLQPFLKDTYAMEQLHHAIKDGTLPLNHRRSASDPSFLSLLAFGAHTRRTQFLLRMRADPDVADVDGVTALMATIHGRHHHLQQERPVRMTKARPQDHYKGVFLEIFQSRPNLSLRDASGKSALSLAFEFGMTDLVRVLIRYGASLTSSPEAQQAMHQEAQPVRRGLAERPVSPAMVAHLFTPLVGKMVSGTIYAFAAPLLYWDVPNDTCWCDACKASPIETSPVVVCWGSLATFAGYAGEEEPVASLPHKTGLQDKVVDESNVEAVCGQVRSILTTMRIAAAKHPLALLMPCFHSDELKVAREKLTQFAFEELQADAFYIANSFVSSLYATGRTTGVVITVDRQVAISCIYEGFDLPQAFSRTPLEGQTDVERAMCVAEKAYAALMSCDAEVREEFSSIVLVGDRVEKESVIAGLRERCGQHWQPRVVVADPHAAWQGGSILSSLSTSCGMWATAREYAEMGPAIASRKFF